MKKRYRKNRFILFMFFAMYLIFFLIPLVSSASILIMLKNGKSYITHKYWVEGDQIRFHLYGGVVGVPQESVQEIKETDRPVVEPDAGEEPDAGIDDKKVEEKPEEGGVVPEATLTDEEKKLSLEQRLKGGLEEYKAAKVQGDTGLASRKYKEASELSAELERFKEEATIKNGGALPGWWK